MSRIGVLIIDDSALTRSLLTEVVRREPDMQVLGVAADGVEGLELCKKLKPQVVTVDVEMPRMNGLEFLTRVKAVHSCQVLMISSTTQHGADQTFKALSAGAFDYVSKPNRAAQTNFDDFAREIVEKIRHAASRRTQLVPKAPSSSPLERAPVEPKLDLAHPNSIIAIGASTGGPPLLTEMLKGLSPAMPPMVIAMHMPVPFTGMFAGRLRAQFGIPISEAIDNEELQRGRVYLIPGNRHATVRMAARNYQLQLHADDGLSDYRPSIDRLFKSLSESAGPHAIALVLTGMGSDGVDGCRAIRTRRGYVISQDEASSTMYGMPKAVSDEHLADWVASPAEITARLSRLLTRSTVS